MERIIINDAVCLFDLSKAGLLESFFKLPFYFVVPDIIRKNELLSLSSKELGLIDRKSEISALDDVGVLAVYALMSKNPKLSAPDCFALIGAKIKGERAILFTGDGNLRRVAERKRIEVHGIIWVLEEIYNHKVVSKTGILEAISFYKHDKTVRLPLNELEKLRKKISGG